MMQKTPNIQFKSQEELESYAAKNNKLLVVCDEYVLDATSFASHHPGGAGLILNHRSKDITREMKDHYPLSLEMANRMAIGTFQKQIRRLIDPDKPLLNQIWDMDHQRYVKICQSPHWLFRESPRFFQSDYMQPLSINGPLRIFIVPIIVIVYILCTFSYANRVYNPLAYVLLFLFGALFWTLTEYCMHRFLFHSERRLYDNRVLRYGHFLLHGCHHMLPNDPNRLVFPPTLAAIVITIGYYLFCKPFRSEDDLATLSFWVGFLSTYLIYDTIHYMLHHSKGKKGTYFHKLQQYHIKHHFSGQGAGYGVSNKFWDIVFNTELSKGTKH